MIFLSLKIVDIRVETSNVKTFSFKQPGLKKIKYFPGQYITLVFRINGRKYSRPYSLSSALGIDEHIEITVKKFPGGIVSNYMNDVLKIGDFVEVMNPMGEFTFDHEIIDKGKHIVFWGAGSGVTPLFSIIKHILIKRTGHKITLVYGNKNKESVIFAEKLRELANLYFDEFNIFYFYSELVPLLQNSDFFPGRVNPDKVLLLLHRKVNLTESVHYICGPTGLKESVKNALKTFGIDEARLYSEDFEVKKNPEDFDGITTRTVEILKDKSKNIVDVIKGKSILEAGLDAFIDLDYSCQTGSCLVCKAKILSGDIRVIGVSKKPEALHDDECLLCCSYPLTNDVVVSI